MRFAIPVANGRLAMHFGHCAQFALVDADAGQKLIQQVQLVDAPEHVPGLLPRWLGERKAEVVIAGGMGARALGLFAEQGIEVIVGAPANETPEALVGLYLNGALVAGSNACDH